MMDEGTFRGFVAVGIDPAVRAFLGSCVKEAAKEFPGYRFGAVENLHVTLQFLGEVDKSRIPGLTGLLSAAVAGLPAFRASLGAAGSFPERGTPRVLHVAVDQGRDDLRRVADRARSALSRAGFAPDKPFTAHITLGRQRTGSRGAGGDLSARWRDLFEGLRSKTPAAGWKVAEILLMESILGPAGPTYIPRGRAPLAGA